MWIAAERYAEAGLPTVLVAGERYGTGSSRDWAAKGTHLLGVRAVRAQSFERIHRSNLVGMGILPLRLAPAWRPDELKIAPGDRVEIQADPTTLVPRAPVRVVLRRASGSVDDCEATALLETALDVALIQTGGVPWQPLQSRKQRSIIRCIIISVIISKVEGTINFTNQSG